MDNQYTDVQKDLGRSLAQTKFIAAPESIDIHTSHHHAAPANFIAASISS
jgi:hypothetical protein